MRADGTTDGILKYTVDYTSSATYETGYYRRHMRNMPLYREIDAHFAGKTACGVRVYEALHKFAAADMPEEAAGNPAAVPDMFFPACMRERASRK